MRKITLLFFLIGLILCQPVYSQSKKEKRKAKKETKIREGKPMITPLAGPAYTPELGFTIAGGVMVSFKTNPDDSLIQRSTSPVMIGVSSTGAFFVNTKITSFWLQDKLRIYADLVFKNMPDNYWGVGYDAAYNTPKSDTTTAYDRLWWQINPKFLWQFKKNNFLGLNVDFNYTKGSDPSQGVSDDPYYIKYNPRPFNSGIGLVYQYDSRDVPVNSWKGLFAEVNYTYYGKYLGGDNNYQMLTLDLRKYYQIKRPGNTLAFQFKGRFTTGDVPYGEMSQLGTPFDLRGYTWGRYRHESIMFLIPEYRHTFLKQDGELSKHGAVLWAGAGTLGDAVTNIDGWLPNLGVGYRFEVQPRMNVRFDIGFGKESMGFYFNFCEAF
jgi:hypothetical protein